jgi:hypothetical protein
MAEARAENTCSFWDTHVDLLAKLKRNLRLRPALGLGAEKSRADAESLCNEVRRMLVALHSKLKN